MKGFALRFLVGAVTTAIIVGAVFGNPTLAGFFLIFAVIIAAMWALGDALIALAVDAWSGWHRKKGW